jgi:hypothetical protein
MKNISQNTADGGCNANPLGDAVEPAGKLFQADQAIRPVRVKADERAVDAVRIYYHENAIYRGFCWKYGV